MEQPGRPEAVFHVEHWREWSRLGWVGGWYAAGCGFVIEGLRLVLPGGFWLGLFGSTFLGCFLWSCYAPGHDDG